MDLCTKWWLKNTICLNFKNYNKRYVAINIHQDIPPWFKYTYPITLALSDAGLEVLFSECVYEVWSKHTECCCWMPSIGKAGLEKHYVFTSLALHYFWLFPKVKVPWKIDILSQIRISREPKPAKDTHERGSLSSCPPFICMTVHKSTLSLVLGASFFLRVPMSCKALVK